MMARGVPLQQSFQHQNSSTSTNNIHTKNDDIVERDVTVVDEQHQTCHDASTEKASLTSNLGESESITIPRSTTMDELRAIGSMPRNNSIADIALTATNSSSSDLQEKECSSSVCCLDDVDLASGGENSTSYDTDDVMPSGCHGSLAELDSCYGFTTSEKQGPGPLHLNVPHEISNDDSDRLLRRRRRRSRLKKPESMTDTVEGLILPQVSDPDAYMLQRQMTITQERWNAITMLPGPVFCLYYLLNAKWLNVIPTSDLTVEAWEVNGRFEVDSACWPTSAWHHVPSSPPLAVLALVLAVIIHAPFSVIYHLTAAHLTAHQRTIHWSRRLDQSMIHAASALVCLATSGSWQYFCTNVWYNVDCIYRQFLPSVRPRRNQLRLSIAVVLAYLLPLLRRQQWGIFTRLSILLALSFVLFTRYPIGGWSHAAFHLVLALTPPLLLQAAVTLESSQPALEQAVACQIQLQQLMQPPLVS